MKKLEESVIARLTKDNFIFEILVDLEKAIKLREGKQINIEEVLIYEEIFKDAKKGERVSEEVLKKVFGTTDIFKIAEEIIKKGDIQITTEYRRKLIDLKRKQIIEILRKMVIDPYTKLPYTYERLEEVLEKAKVKIDPFIPAEKQVEEILKKIKTIIPIKIEYICLKVKIPYSDLKYLGKIKQKYQLLKEDWDDYGWFGILKIPRAILGEFYDDINKYFKEKIEIEEIDSF